MATTRSARGNGDGHKSAVAQTRVVHVQVPVVNCGIDVPREMIPFYAGLAVTALLDLIDWPLALILGAGHYIVARSHSQAIRELTEGLEAGA